MFGLAQMRFRGGVMNGLTFTVDPLPVVLFTVYRPMPSTFNKEWDWCYAMYWRTARGYTFVGYNSVERVSEIILDNGLDFEQVFQVNP